MRLLFLPLRRALVIVASTSIFLASSSAMFGSVAANAAEQVVLKYLVFRQSVSVEELSTFAETGELSRSLQVNLRLAKQDPKVVRQYLTEPVEVNLIFLDRVLNSPVGNILLDELSRFVHTPSGLADRQALRSALVISASGDNTISLIEVIRNYPTSQVEVEGERLEGAYRQLQRLRGTLQDLLGILGG